MTTPEQMPVGHHDGQRVVSKWKENFRLSQPTPGLLLGDILFHLVEATNYLLTIPS